MRAAGVVLRVGLPLCGWAGREWPAGIFHLRCRCLHAKKYVLQLLYIEGAVAAKWFEEWVLVDGVTKHKVAIDRLVQLRVLTEMVDRKKEATYVLNPKFQRNLQKHIVLGGTLPREPMPRNITVRLPSLEELDAYAVEQWELMDTNAQLWYNIREYITNCEEIGLDTVDLIAFLLELSFHVTGKVLVPRLLQKITFYLLFASKSSRS